MRERANKRIATEISIIVSVFLSLFHYTLTSLQLENTSIMELITILLNIIFHFHEPKKPLNAPKNKIIKTEEILSKVKFMQISFKENLKWPDIGRARYRGVNSGR